MSTAQEMIHATELQQQDEQAPLLPPQQPPTLIRRSLSFPFYQPPPPLPPLQPPQQSQHVPTLQPPQQFPPVLPVQQPQQPQPQLDVFHDWIANFLTARTNWWASLQNANSFPLKVWIFLYGHGVLLFVQMWVAFIGATICARKIDTSDNDSGIGIARQLASPLSAVYFGFVVFLTIRDARIRELLANPNRFLISFLFALRVALVLGLIRVFVLIADVLGGAKNLDGNTVAFFLLSYLHIVSLSKFFVIEDYICLADSLLAIAILLSARIEMVKPRETILRTFYTYGSASILVAFRFSEVPFGNNW